MGHMKHHAIIVTSYVDLNDALAKAHEFGNVTTHIASSGLNGYQTFVVVPDGSKEGWENSAAGDKSRAAFLAWIESQAYEDGSNKYDWAEVMYGGDGAEIGDENRAMVGLRTAISDPPLLTGYEDD